MVSKQNAKDKLWNAIFTVLYLVLLGFLFKVLEMTNNLSFQIDFLEIAIIVLAIQRLIRLLVYDKIFFFVRDYFENYKSPGIKKTIHELLICPWCTGIWVTPIVIFGFLMHPIVFFLLLVLAISTLATILQLIANLIGHSAEKKKLECQKLQK